MVKGRMKNGRMSKGATDGVSAYINTGAWIQKGPKIKFKTKNKI